MGSPETSEPFLSDDLSAALTGYRGAKFVANVGLSRKQAHAKSGSMTGWRTKQTLVKRLVLSGVQL